MFAHLDRLLNVRPRLRKQESQSQARPEPASAASLTPPTDETPRHIVVRVPKIYVMHEDVRAESN